MAGVPQDGTAPGMPPPPEKGGGAGGIFATLLGVKHAENLRKDERLGKTVMDFLHGYTTGVVKAPPEFVDLMVTTFGKVYGKEVGGQMKGVVDQFKAAEDLKQRQKLLAQQPTGQAPPMMGPTAPAAPAPPQNSSTGPTAGGGIGFPKPPFEEGAAAGPAPQQANPVDPRAVASIKGTEGFGIPPPTPSTIFRLGPEQVGIDEAAQNRPGLQQTNALALEQKRAENVMALGQRGAKHGQDVEWKVAEAKRLTDAVRSDPNFSKLPALQQQEILMRAMGIQGAVSNIPRPMNLPASAIPGSEIPENSLTIAGAPTDPKKWYRQQQDFASGEMRYFEVEPRLTTKQVLTKKGSVLVSIDPRGQIAKATYAIDGSPILDPTMLATISTALNKNTTVDEQGNPVTVWDPTVTTHGKVLPGGAAPQAPGLPPMPGTQPSATPGGAQPTAPASAPGAPAPRPQPLTAATRAAAEFAQTITPHIPKVEAMIKGLGEKGKLGPLMGRWNEFLTGKYGDGDPDFTKLRTALKFLQTATVRVHARAGNTAMLAHFESLFNSDKMSEATLQSAIGEAKDWISTYANMGANRPGAVRMNGMPSPPANLPPPPTGSRSLDEIIPIPGKRP